MALPTNVGYGTVTGRFMLAYADGSDGDLFPDGVPAKGTVYLTPSPIYLRNALAAPAPVTILPSTVECALDAEGYVLGTDGNPGVRLVATDDVDNNPVNWTWSVEFRLTDQDNVPIRTIPKFSFELPQGTSVDLTDVTPVTDANGTFYLVGPTGPSNSLSVGTVDTLTPAQSVTVDITGTSPSQTINFGIPQGLAATIAAGTTTTSVPGTPAAVANSGSTGSAVFDFSIPQGAAATVAAGTTTTVSTGTPASVSNSGTSADAILDFTIPEGPTGLTGDTGTAATITAGTTTTVAPGIPATATNSGTTADAVLDFDIPQGAAATIAVGATTTVVNGTAAAVSNSGTTGEAILDFTIPAGPTGPQGVIGLTGATGIEWQGLWSSGTDYVDNDAVFYDGASWFASGDPTLGEIPSNASTEWYPLALQGIQGDQGIQGIQGDQGIQGIQGIQGVQGETGLTGDAATIAVGTVATGAAGSTAVITNTGTSGAAVFDITIPKGDTGSLGALTGISPIVYSSGSAEISLDQSALVLDGGTA